MKILIIHTAFIGDVVLSIPLLKRIKECYHGSKITYLTTPVGASILRNNPNISEIIEYDKRGLHKGIKGIWQLGKRLRYENFNMVLTLHRYFRSSILSWLSRAKVRKGYNVATGAFLFTEKIKYDRAKHEVEKVLSFLGEIEGDLKEKYPIELYPDKRVIESIDRVWNQYGLWNEKTVAIAPGSKWFTKRWPIEYFDQLIDKLLNEKIKLIIIGGEEEKKLNISRVSETIDLRGNTTLLEVAEILKRSSCVVTNDSSPLHIASAFKDTAIVAIFGPTVERFGFFPWSKNSEVLQVDGLKCRPCAIHGGDRCPKRNFKCMKDIKPDFLFDKVMQKIGD